MYCLSLRTKTFSIASFISKILYWEIERWNYLTDQKDNINLGKNVSDDNNQQNKSRACLVQTCSRSLIVFLFQLVEFFDYIWLLLDNSFFRKKWRFNCVGRKFVYCSRKHFTLTKTRNMLITSNNCIFISLVGPSGTISDNLFLNGLKVELF